MLSSAMTVILNFLHRFFFFKIILVPANRVFGNNRAAVSQS